MNQEVTNSRDDEVRDELPELPLSPHPNYVTAEGLAQLRKRLADGEARLAGLEQDRVGEEDDRLHIERELRWLQARAGSAIELPAERRREDRVGFGASVEVVGEDGQRHRYRIVGEDEADPDEGLISWVSPLARALEGAQVGESVVWERPAGDLRVEVRAVSHTAPG